MKAKETSVFNEKEKESFIQVAKTFRNTCYSYKSKCITCPLSNLCDLLDYSNNIIQVADELLKL